MSSTSIFGTFRRRKKKSSFTEESEIEINQNQGVPPSPVFSSTPNLFKIDTLSRKRGRNHKNRVEPKNESIGEGGSLRTEMKSGSMKSFLSMMNIMGGSLKRSKSIRKLGWGSSLVRSGIINV
jgi:hypothetical protein